MRCRDSYVLYFVKDVDASWTKTEQHQIFHNLYTQLHRRVMNMSTTANIHIHADFAVECVSTGKMCELLLNHLPIYPLNVAVKICILQQTTGNLARSNFELYLVTTKLYNLF